MEISLEDVLRIKESEKITCGTRDNGNKSLANINICLFSSKDQNYDNNKIKTINKNINSKFGNRDTKYPCRF